VTSWAEGFVRVAIVATLGSYPAIGGEPEAARVSSTLERFQELLRSSVRAETQRAGLGDAGNLHSLVQPPEVRWFLGLAAQEGCSDSLQSRQASDSVAYDVEISVIEYGVRYDNLRQEGIFGSRSVDRVVNMHIQTRFTERSSARVVRQSEMDTTATDTVEVSQISQIEHPNVVATHARLPEEGFFSGWAEPLVVVGSVVVAVFLLFTIRS
jgi:hypothetical protein